MATRLKGRFGYPADEPFRVTFHPDRLEVPLHWKKPRHIFVSSMGDLFHKSVEDDWIHSVLSVAISTYYGYHTYILLTKRPARMMQFSKYFTSSRIWLGVTAENQARADERIPILLQIPAAVRFVSYEPALGPIDLSQYLPRWEWHYHDPVTNQDVYSDDKIRSAGSSKIIRYPDDPYINGIIAGCESGPGRRPAKVQWFRDIKDQCVEAKVPFFLKQAVMFGGKNGGNFYDKVLSMPILDGRVWDQVPR